MQGPHEANGGPAGATDGRQGQAGRGSADLSPEHQEGQGQGRGLHQAPRVLHIPPKVGDKNIQLYPKKPVSVYKPLCGGISCRSLSLWTQ